MKKIIRVVVFWVLAMASALFSEEWPRIFIGAPLRGLSWRDPIHIWNVTGWPWWILGWYTIIFFIAYFFFKDKKIKWPVLYGMVVGLLAETFLFKKMSFPGFFLFIVAYGIMFYIPFKIIKKIS